MLSKNAKLGQVAYRCVAWVSWPTFNF